MVVHSRHSGRHHHSHPYGRLTGVVASFGDYRLHTLRQVVLHVITETACHAGQLDATRELIDGRQWLVLTE